MVQRSQFRWHGRQPKIRRFSVGRFDPSHREQQINSGGFQAEKVVHHLADVRIALPDPVSETA
jgi:hypothetical protein